jgi:hypothetical protein
MKSPVKDGITHRHKSSKYSMLALSIGQPNIYPMSYNIYIGMPYSISAHCPPPPKELDTISSDVDRM